MTAHGPLATLERSTYLTRLDWHLEEQVPGAERRTILKDLRAEIEADPRPVGEVLDDLGRPSALAQRYGEGRERRYPRWSAGVVAAAVALLLYWLVFFGFAAGMLAAIGSLGGGQATATFLGIPLIAFDRPGEYGIGWTGDAAAGLAGWAWLLVPLLVVGVTFLLSSRIWRLWRTPR
ncbi:MAG: hypothetical protein QM804_14220 [Propionicimonas sp.]